jgi:4-hydroxyphenylpyruvate dioxygenase
MKLIKTKTETLKYWNMNQDFLPLKGTDHIEFYVGNAKQSAYYYQTAFGFDLIAYSGPETGLKDRCSYVLKQNKITLVLTTSLQPGSEISEHVKKHGDGVKVLALWVDDAEAAFYETTSRGAQPAQAPHIYSDEYGEVKLSSIHTYGETIHTFVERKNYKGIFLPGFVPQSNKFEVKSIGLEYTIFFMY